MKDRVIIVIKGGLVQNVYSTNSDLDVDVLDNDIQKDCDPTKEDVEYYYKLKVELDDPNTQFSEVY